MSTPNFDSNRGADNTLFFGGTLGGLLTGTSFTVSGNTFNYDPFLGNLLLDIRISNRTGTPGYTFFDARDGPAGGVFSRAHNFGGGFANYGLVTGFEATAVPEPASLLLLGTGLGVLGLAAWRRKK